MGVGTRESKFEMGCVGSEVGASFAVQLFVHCRNACFKIRSGDEGKILVARDKRHGQVAARRSFFATCMIKARV